jgi:peptide/nickel transport system substrate-binding protein
MAGLAALLLPFASACRHPVADERRTTPLRVGVGIGRTARQASVDVLIDLLHSESLFRREWSGRTTPHLVANWRWESGGQGLWLELKEGVVFHDGTRLTSALVADYLRRLLPTPERKATWGFAHVTAIQETGPMTLSLQLSQPDMFLLAALSDTRIVLPQNPDIATGPFRLVSRGPDVETQRFERYHGGAPAFPGVRIVTYATQRSAWAALMRDEVDVVQEVSRESVEFMQGASEIQTFSSLQPFYIPLVFNHRHPQLAMREVRRAMSQALDRDEIVELGMRGRGRPAVGPVWPFHWAYEGAEHPGDGAHDPAAARAFLDRSGLPHPDPAPGRPPSRLRLQCLVYSEDPQYERIALLAQRQLFDIGVDLVIELLPMDALTARIAEGRFETYVLPANASRTLERVYRSWHSSGPEGPAQLNTGYAGADAVLEALRRSTDDAEIRRNVMALAQKFEEDAPAAFIAWMDVTRAVSARVSVGGERNDDPFINIRQWRPVVR